MVLEVDRTFQALNHGTGWPHGKPKAVVVHATRGGQPNRQSIAGHRLETTSTINWFLSGASQASTNLIVSPVEIVRMVSDEDYAWHAWEHSSRTYSIELTQSLPTDPFLDGHYELLARAGRHYVSLGVPPVYLPHYSNGMEGFTGHEDSEQGVRDGKSDPGDQFDWDRFIAMIQEPEATVNDPRLDVLILTHGGRPKVFDILTGDGEGGVTWRQDALTYYQWMRYSALGWLKLRPHEHDVTGTAR